MSDAGNAAAAIEAAVARAIAKYAPFVAIVADTDGALVSIQRPESATPEDEWYARVAGGSLSQGDEVLCIHVAGKPVVIGEIAS